MSKFLLGLGKGSFLLLLANLPFLVFINEFHFIFVSKSETSPLYLST